MRLDKYLERQGYGDKETVHQYIKNGLIQVNSAVVFDFHYQLLDIDKVSVNPSIKKYKQYYYYLFNKPEGYLSSRKDESQATIMDLLPELKDKNLNIVGRLDIDTKGLILLTNNNKLYKYLIDPQNCIKKKYIVEYAGKYQFESIYPNGIILENNEKTKPFIINSIDEDHAEIILTEGKFHEVKRIFAVFNLKVISLKRTAIHNLSLGELKEGSYRELNQKEVDELTMLIK